LSDILQKNQDAKIQIVHEIHWIFSSDLF